MGNSSTKESGARQSRSRENSIRDASHSDAAHQQQPQPQQQAPQSSSERFIQELYGVRSGGHGSRPDLSFLRLGSNNERDGNQAEQRRETKQEREARKLEKENAAREKERERSLREEGVDGGYLVTLGVYTGPEDFNKSVIRQLQIERRLAPFWKGLNDHNDSWTEHQLVAAARGLPIPAADEITPAMDRTTSQMSNDQKPDAAQVQGLTVPISGRSLSNQSDPTRTASSSSLPHSQSGPNLSIPSSMPLFRGRAKTLASLTTSSRTNSATNLVPQEVQLPREPNFNGQPIEAYLYKDASECPICFMYYPPYLNKTRCCDQPICSECFVQIKRPDPHVPEHHDDPSNPPAEPKPEEEINLVSEPSQCPFCVTAEFGVTYEPPPFRRGLAYPGGGPHHPLVSATSAMSSQTSLGSMGSRRRTTSLSATDKSVITTDRIRPDWAKKLADARAHALRRSAAATALHNAAYVLGNVQNMEGRGLHLGRRRRTLLGGDSSGASGSATPEGGNLATLLARTRIDGHADGDLVGGRTSSRRTRVDDLEELMMMEAIRLSLAAEEDRKKKDEKEAQKDAKKRAKEAAKEQKKAEKAAKKAGKAGSLYPASTNESTSSWATSSMARSISNLGDVPHSPTSIIHGKGKAPMNSLGFNPLTEPTSTLNTESGNIAEISNRGLDDPQKHLEESRANLQGPSQPITLQPNHHRRQFSGASSFASSTLDSVPGSYRNESGLDPSPNASGLDVSNSGSEQPTPQPSTLEPMFNFRSLAAMIGEEDKNHHEAQHVEHAEAAPGAERTADASLLTSALQQVEHGSEGPANATSSQVDGVPQDSVSKGHH